MRITFPPLKTPEIDPNTAKASSLIQTEHGELVIKVHDSLYVKLGSRTGHWCTVFNPNWFYDWGRPIRVLKPGDSVHIDL